MTAEQLEELLGKLDNGHPLDAGRAMDELAWLAPELARKVIAADKLVEALDDLRDLATQDFGKQLEAEAGLDAALAAYREASK